MGGAFSPEADFWGRIWVFQMAARILGVGVGSSMGDCPTYSPWLQ
jgi:hypothetical protein